MTGPDRDIEITVFYEGKAHNVKTFANEYRNLMMLIYDKLYTEDFGDCLGMGKCGTCLIEIIGTHGELTSYDRNEDTTIVKAGVDAENIRLSCQILIDIHINGLKIRVK